MDTKRCIIIHGTPNDENDKYFNKHWMPWIKKQLEEKGWEVDKPDMPNPLKKIYKEYKEEFEKYVVDPNTVLIGHSSGCAFLVRWLGDSKQKVRKLILVAPYKMTREDDKFKRNFYKFDVDETIKERVEEIVIFTSDDEEEDGKESAEIFGEALNSKAIELKEHGHYTLRDMDTEEFPELLEIILK